MLTLRFAIDAAQRDGTIDALRRRVLPPLVYRKGIAGVHLCLADDAASSVETAETRVRDDTAPCPRGSCSIEGHFGARRRAAPRTISCRRCRRTARRPSSARSYRLEFTRLKTPWAAG